MKIFVAEVPTKFHGDSVWKWFVYFMHGTLLLSKWPLMPRFTGFDASKTHCIRLIAQVVLDDLRKKTTVFAQKDGGRFPPSSRLLCF